MQTVADIDFIDSERRADQSRTARLMSALCSHPADVSQPQQLSSVTDAEDKSGRSFSGRLMMEKVHKRLTRLSLCFTDAASRRDERPREGEGKGKQREREERVEVKQDSERFLSDLYSASSCSAGHFSKAKRKRGRPKHEERNCFVFDVMFADGSTRRDVPFSALRPLTSTADALKALAISRRAVSEKLAAQGGTFPTETVALTTIEDVIILGAASLLRQATVMESCRFRRVSSASFTKYESAHSI